MRGVRMGGVGRNESFIYRELVSCRERVLAPYRERVPNLEIKKGNLSSSLSSFFVNRRRKSCLLRIFDITLCQLT